MQSSFFRWVISITAKHHSLAHVSPLPRAVGAEPGPASSHSMGTRCWCGVGAVAHLKKQHTPTSDICSAHLHLSRWGRGMISRDTLNNLLTGVFRGELEGRGWLMASLSLTSQPPQLRWPRQVRCCAEPAAKHSWHRTLQLTPDGLKGGGMGWWSYCCGVKGTFPWLVNVPASL